ncbi:glycosyltransferase family 4 protein [Aequorivita sp. SDUM287046]|uniref:Glycosyltransferase family 4 protein n=1 Tax=Aequorivita aurantiaca TaxID=3053356 RepID=A0ABT8DGW5_9FLAO|nr:glycosyltransferase family 4 protein [Aequorivita aurantiaca]MDN3723115.1 glycosyltransferase family 4 protein [Aequorivita aurantiaca]
MQKEILIISNYFPPEKGAAANRISSLAEAMGAAGFNVTVVCPLPNYPTGQVFREYRGKLSAVESASFGKIKRLWIWPSNSANKFVRLLAMVSFSFSLILYFLFAKTPKKVVIQYSPVFVGFTAVWIGRVLSKKIILNVSDLWPLAGLEMGLLQEGTYYNLLQKMEKFCYRNADLILGQSEEILQHISNIENEKALFLYRNIPDFEVYSLGERSPFAEIKIVYAGLLGMAQGLLGICQRLSFPKSVSLHIYGAGPEAEKFKVFQKNNIFFYGEFERERLHIELQKYDIAFVPLVKRIYGSVPSKIFEYSRLGIPILYFAGGEGGEIVKTESLGWVIPVNDFEALQDFINNISELELTRFPKATVSQNSMHTFNFKKQFAALITSIENV